MNNAAIFRLVLLVSCCHALVHVYELSLGWVEKGQALENSQRWGNQADYGLPAIRQKLLKRLGRGSEARELAWSAFREPPSLYGYRELMEYVPRNDRRLWSVTIFKDLINLFNYFHAGCARHAYI